jgi:hypothetical protein
MKSYEWWRGRKKRVRKKYTLFLGKYISPKELKSWHKEWQKAIERAKNHRRLIAELLRKG